MEHEHQAAGAAAVATIAAVPAAQLAAQPLPGDGGERISTDDVFQRVGELTRTLHNALIELGYHTTVEQAVSALPDARTRLNYIATLTGRAAERVLGAAEQCKDIQDSLQREAERLEAAWEAVPGHEAPPVAAATRHFLREAQEQSRMANDHLTDIILAQDFHDLTGQVINRVVKLASDLEEQLLKLLIDTTPPAQRARLMDQPALLGPAIEGVVQGASNDDVVTSQAQVDDLLESLGF